MALVRWFLRLSVVVIASLLFLELQQGIIFSDIKSVTHVSLLVPFWSESPAISDVGPGDPDVPTSPSPPGADDAEGDFLDISTRTCTSQTNNYTNFCPEAAVEGLLSEIRREYRDLFRISRQKAFDALAGKLIFIAGDSLAGQHYLSLCCVLARNETDIIRQMGPQWMWRVQWIIRKPLRCVIIDRTTICYLRSATIWSTPWMSDVLAVSRAYMRPEDVLVLNFGLHFTPIGADGRTWLQYPRRTKALIEEWSCSVPSFRVYFRETSAQHFKTTRGGWWPGRHVLKRGNESYSCYPQLSKREDMENRGYVKTTPVATLNKLNEWSNPRFKEKTGIHILQAWNASAKYWRLHSAYARLDCTHFCLPGIPDLWSLELVRSLLVSNPKAAHDTKATPATARARATYVEGLVGIYLNVTKNRTETRGWERCIDYRNVYSNLTLGG